MSTLVILSDDKIMFNRHVIDVSSVDDYYGYITIEFKPGEIEYASIKYAYSSHGAIADFHHKPSGVIFKLAHAENQRILIIIKEKLEFKKVLGLPTYKVKS